MSHPPKGTHAASQLSLGPLACQQKPPTSSPPQVGTSGSESGSASASEVSSSASGGKIRVRVGVLLNVLLDVAVGFAVGFGVLLNVRVPIGVAVDFGVHQSIEVGIAGTVIIGSDGPEQQRAGHREKRAGEYRDSKNKKYPGSHDPMIPHRSKRGSPRKKVLMPGPDGPGGFWTAARAGMLSPWGGP